MENDKGEAVSKVSEPVGWKRHFRRALGFGQHLVRKATSGLRRFMRDHLRAHEAGGWHSVADLLSRQVKFAALRLTKQGQSEQELIEASARYWNEGQKAGVPLEDYSHWSGAGPWADRERWLRLGRVHHRMFERMQAICEPGRALRRVVEWGSGGGANAIHFVNDADVYCGIEIAQASLDECGRILSEVGFRGFIPVLIPAESPEEARLHGAGTFDFFLCTYVFELLPSKAYGERVLRIAFSLLAPGGMALVQIRYEDGSERSTQKDIDYYKNASRFTSYRIDEFWKLAASIDFECNYVTLVPERTADYSGDLYAYFVMKKPSSLGHDDGS